MKKVVLLAPTPPPAGGIATWTLELMRQCQTQGIEIALVNMQMVGKRSALSTGKRNMTDELRRSTHIFRQLNQVLAHKEALLGVAHLNTSCGKFGLLRDLLLAQRIKRAGLRLLVHYHCDVPYQVRSRVSRWAVGRLASLADRNLVLCGTSQRYLAQELGAQSEMVPNFIRSDALSQDRKEISESLSHLCFVGRVSLEKGAREIYALAARFPEITFELIGELSGEVATWEKPENITHAGLLPHDQVLRRLDAADAFLFPSHSEGFSIALLESMARGLPALATDVGANADMLAQGCGAVVPMADVEAMAKALESMRDPQVRRAMSENALQKVREHYTAEAVTKQLEAFYYEKSRR